MAPLFLLMVTLLGSDFGQAQNSAYESSLRRTLFANYDPMVAPSVPIHLHFGISPVKVVDVDAERGVVTVDLWLKNQWVDDRLRWNPTEFGNVTTVFGTEDTVYTPETELYNGVMTRSVAGPDIVVYPGGQMIFFPAVRAEVYCDVPAAPFQDQICPIIIGPWAHDARQIQLLAFDPVVDHSFVYNTGNYRIGLSTASITSSEYDCCPGLSFDIMTLGLNISTRADARKRRSPATAGEALRREFASPEADQAGDFSRGSLPLILTPFHILLLFLLPAKSSHRIFLGTMIFVALLIVWTSGVMSPDQEGFMLMSVCMTVAATCVSLVPCVISSFGYPAEGDAKTSLCKSRIVRTFDLLMLAAVAVVLGISTAGVFA